jgi:hypothetical protein
MTRRACYLVTLLLFAASVSTRADTLPSNCAVLPVSSSAAALKQCSRSTPQHVTEFWTPSTPEVLAADQRLPALLRASGHKIDLAKSYRQYVGFISGGKRFIYINALPATRHSPQDWRSAAFVICDGGDAFWGVEFDPSDATFHNLQFNGEA